MRTERRRVVGLVVAVVVVIVGAWVFAAHLDAKEEEDVFHAHPPIPSNAFRISDDCALCHSEAAEAQAMHDAAGRDVSPFALWQSSMMANAARDPVWQAAVAVEMAATPSQAEAIEQACMRCHAPMAEPGTGIAQFLLSESDVSPLAPDANGLATDGVSCTVCHRILPDGLGTADSFSGNWRIDPGDRVFGPHKDLFLPPMRLHTGLTATASDHVLDAGLCGTCHTLFTDALSADGRPTGSRLPEQSPYLEWRNSRYSTEVDTPAPEAATCQDCHLPTTDLDGGPIRTRIARNPRGRDFGRIEARAPFGRHDLVGANTLTPKLLQDPALLARVKAPASAFEQTLARVREQLSAAADLDVVRLEGDAQDGLVMDLRVINLTGHRLPTAHPTRRVWLEVVVEDSRGKRLFASGLTDAAGRILGADGKPLASERAGGPVLPHRDRITNGDEVALYEATMVDDEGCPTNLLIRGTRFAKDDRLLPAGWRQDGPHPEATLPHGVEGDADFGAGGDVVHYRIPLPDTAAPGMEIRVRLLHQTVGARWLAEWFEFDLPATRLLKSLLARTPARPEEIARLRITVTPK